MFNFLKSSNLSQDKAYEQLQQDKTIKLIDVRTSGEFKDGHVKGAVNIPLNTLPQKYSGMLPNKEQTIFVICLSGARASDATDFLKKAGYTNVHNIGGVGSWKFGLVK
jgi:rhodanese-related sulfurtransferase